MILFLPMFTPSSTTNSCPLFHICQRTQQATSLSPAGVLPTLCQTPCQFFPFLLGTFVETRDFLNTETSPLHSPPTLPLHFPPPSVGHQAQGSELTLTLGISEYFICLVRCHRYHCYPNSVSPHLTQVRFTVC